MDCIKFPESSSKMRTQNSPLDLTAGMEAVDDLGTLPLHGHATCAVGQSTLRRVLRWSNVLL